MTASRPAPAPRWSAGQSTLELALGLPVVALMLLAVVQVGLLVQGQVLVTHAAREGARAAAVDGDPGAARRAVLASSALDPARTTVAVRGSPPSRVTVEVRYRAATAVPIVGALLGDVDLRATATMRDERATAPGAGQPRAGPAGPRFRSMSGRR